MSTTSERCGLCGKKLTVAEQKKAGVVAFFTEKSRWACKSCYDSFMSGNKAVTYNSSTEFRFDDTQDNILTISTEADRTEFIFYHDDGKSGIIITKDTVSYIGEMVPEEAAQIFFDCLQKLLYLKETNES